MAALNLVTQEDQEDLEKYTDIFIKASALGSFDDADLFANKLVKVVDNSTIPLFVINYWEMLEEKRSVNYTVCSILPFF
jgi:hypothetical protein